MHLKVKFLEADKYTVLRIVYVNCFSVQLKTFLIVLISFLPHCKAGQTTLFFAAY